MKSLRPLALLALTASAAQAYNIEFQFGNQKPQTGDVAGPYKADNLTGIAWSFSANEQISLGLTYSMGTLERATTPTKQYDTKAVTFDVTYELAPSQSGIKPFVGLSLGNSWIDTPTGNDTAITGKLGAGLRFNISDSVELVLGARYFTLWNVQYAPAVVLPAPAAAIEDNAKGWESFAALRLKF